MIFWYNTSSSVFDNYYFFITMSYFVFKSVVNVTDGSEVDDELTVAINRKREKKDPAFGRKRLDKDAMNVKSKKKSRVLVEVNTCYRLLHFRQTLSIALRSHL